MNKILAPNIANDGKYGTEAIEAVGDAAEAVYQLVEATYLDDRQITIDDAIDAALIGPKVVRSIQTAITKGSAIGDEVTDLSENEKARLRTKYGAKLENPSFNKIFNGLLELIDGASELANPDNPVA